ncbi:bifunctional diaminohydroxyphosphoribosylaminopyrimidine deaminase/5-amino-6-(5-phosphoribosylamino)uracil reductase RibD [Azospirillum halopraeferens]|uniref:bifunctional diaminohydroxyphosphoribosylaminopyrimidine deaminase/5-amino-6-(5-phosphoribosylamino)uracil reductase RibD n=1 Tax=Azospirillum halopraeferens TaxID=34010 RepID=UPI00042918F0|nr:bifunctional diaminohydroxyphosphoribosylaminopyrimidine deaminase/5-amino-6-(5-phosphoribosylamino)uracil reductase RibD [Azospirillum halopraeferens]
MPFDADDRRHMLAALGLAARGLGTVMPNPAVGCVLVRDGTVVGRGWTQPGGRPHAETEALRRAGAAARGATAYVSLEPCNHHGKTPPCTEALLAAGVARVVVACEDPDPRVAGGGVHRLRAAGVAVDVGLCTAEALDLNRGFFSRILHGRPSFTLKLATTLDGRIATHGGESRWITGPEARARGHALRATHDAIMIGIGTALADDPELTCRLPGLSHRSPLRIVVDSRLRLPLTGRLAATARDVPTWILTREDADGTRAAAFTDCGVEVLRIPADGAGLPDVTRAGALLGERGVTRVLVEGGATLAASLLRAGLIDRVEWFRAASVIGGDGLAAVAPFGVDALAAAVRFTCTGVRRCGADVVESYVRVDT